MELETNGCGRRQRNPTDGRWPLNNRILDLTLATWKCSGLSVSTTSSSALAGCADRKPSRTPLNLMILDMAVGYDCRCGCDWLQLPTTITITNKITNTTQCDRAGRRRRRDDGHSSCSRTGPTTAANRRICSRRDVYRPDPTRPEPTRSSERRAAASRRDSTRSSHTDTGTSTDGRSRRTNTSRMKYNESTSRGRQWRVQTANDDVDD